MIDSELVKERDRRYLKYVKEIPGYVAALL